MTAMATQSSSSNGNGRWVGDEGELADKAAVSRSTIMRAEAGGIVSFSTIRQLAAALEISIEQLVHADAARKEAPVAE